MERREFLKAVTLVPAVAAAPLTPSENPAAPGAHYPGQRKRA
jgi:hypothetical protein